MEISVSDAKAQLTDLVKRAEAGEEVVLTRHGHAVARIAAVRSEADVAAWLKIIDEVRRAGRAKAIPGESAARSQDFLYDKDGMPG